MRRALPYVPLALAVPAMWLLTQGQPGVAPVAAVAVAAGAAVAGRCALCIQRRVWIDVVLAALLGVAATHLLLAVPGFPRGHDSSYHLWGTYGLYRSVASGNPMPRWIHHLGAGMPLFLFYPVAPFLTMLPFIAAGAPIYNAFKFGFVVMSATSGVTMFAVVRRWTGSRRAALVAAGAYCVAPHHMVHSNARTAVAEAMAMVALPLFFYATTRCLESPTWRRAKWAIGATAALALVHPLTLLLAGIGAGLWVLCRHRFTPGKPLLLSLALLAAIGIGGGVGLAGFYTLPIAVEGKATVVRQSYLSGSRSFYYHHGLRLRQLVERRAWTHYQSSEPRGAASEADEMPFYFGLVLLALLPLARCRERPERILGLWGMTAGCLALTQWPLDMALSHAPLLPVVQYPWRFLSVATFGACALVGFATARVGEDLAGRPIAARLAPGVLFALILIDCFPYTGAMAWVAPYDGLENNQTLVSPAPLRVEGLTYPPSDPGIDVSLLRQVYPQYFTHWTRARIRLSESDRVLERVGVGMSYVDGAARALSPAPYAEFRPRGDRSVRALRYTRGGGRITVELPGEPGTLVIKEQWFPGWDTGGRELARTRDGLMRVDLSATDRGELRLSFSRTHGARGVGLVLSLLTLLSLAWRPKRR